jgi:hypothetical protein
LKKCLQNISPPEAQLSKGPKSSSIVSALPDGWDSRKIFNLYLDKNLPEERIYERCTDIEAVESEEQYDEHINYKDAGFHRLIKPHNL